MRLLLFIFKYGVNNISNWVMFNEGSTVSPSHPLTSAQDESCVGFFIQVCFYCKPFLKQRGNFTDRDAGLKWRRSLTTFGNDGEEIQLRMLQHTVELGRKNIKFIILGTSWRNAKMQSLHNVEKNWTTCTGKICTVTLERLQCELQ
jgi:hypothetical protein